MSRRLVPDSAQPCIWMNAGLLTYKLCDRGLQCDRCPLDAGLRGKADSQLCYQSLRTPDCGATEFPNDRRYTSGHTWIQPMESGNGARWRFGLDAFAAAILGHCREILWHETEGAFARGDPFCDIDFGLGVISMRVPLACAAVDTNQSLLSAPNRLVTEPYHRGWIAEFAPADENECDGFLDALAARNKARRDLQWFRRQTALRFLADSQEDGDHQSDRVSQLADIREMLAGSTYLKLLPELVH